MARARAKAPLRRREVSTNHDQGTTTTRSTSLASPAAASLAAVLLSTSLPKQPSRPGSPGPPGPQKRDGNWYTAAVYCRCRPRPSSLSAVNIGLPEGLSRPCVAGSQQASKSRWGWVYVLPLHRAPLRSQRSWTGV